jgi:alkenylglycerophosphocholine hydrolase
MLWILGALAAVGFLVAVPLDLPALRGVGRPLPVLCMAGVVLMATPSRYTQLVAAGLGLSALGDLLIEVGWFVPGMGAFLVANLAYIGAYVTDVRSLRLVLAVPPLVLGVVVIVFLAPLVGSMLVPVAIYTMVVCAMLWRAWARVLPGASEAENRSRWYALAGAATFAASSVLVALGQFGQPPEVLIYPTMLLYWGGQLGIAVSAIVLRPPVEA